MSRKRFYKSTAWKRARADFIAFRMAMDGGLCQVCGEVPGLIVHHKIWLTDDNVNDPEISLNPQNFRYECQICHNAERDPAKGERTAGRVRFGPDGEVIPVGSY